MRVEVELSGERKGYQEVVRTNYEKVLLISSTPLTLCDIYSPMSIVIVGFRDIIAVKY